MENKWLTYEETFVKMQYNNMPIQVIAKALNKDINEVREKAIELGLETVEEITKTKGQRKKYEVKNIKYYRIKETLENILNGLLEYDTSVIMNIHEIANLWETPYRQSKVHLYNMLKDENFRYKVCKRDTNGFYAFERRANGDNSYLPIIEEETLISDTNIIKSIPKAKVVGWNKNTNRIVEYIINKIKSSEHGFIDVKNTELMEKLNLSNSAVKTHTALINNADECVIEKIKLIYKHGNYYKLKGSTIDVKHQSLVNTSRRNFNLREERKEAGLCIQCGEKLDRVGVRCVKCNKSCNISKQKYKNQMMKDNRCRNCLQPLDREGRYCIKCAKITSIRAQEKGKYRKENGLCTRCGEVSDAGTYCLKCREYTNAKNKRYRESKKQQVAK